MQSVQEATSTATVETAPEAKHLFVLMKRHYRISRNVRAQWYFCNLNQIVRLASEEEVEKEDIDLAIIGALPEGSSKYKMTPATWVTFLSRNYRLVFVLDFSPSTAIADSDLNCVLQDNVFTSFRNFLIGLVQPFRIPSRTSLFSPQLRITVIAYTPFLRNRSRQVLLQGCSLNISNLWPILREIENSLHRFLRGVAEASAFAVNTDQRRHKFYSFNEMEKSTLHLTDRKAANASENSVPLQVPSDSILIDMVRFGMLAVQLLPENTSAGMIFFTDGVLGVPDVSILETLLTQLRIWTIGCTFVLVQSKSCNPDCAFGKVPNTEFMRFLASATFGAYLETCPNVGPSPEKAINLYHKAILCWSFQRALDLTRHEWSNSKAETSLLQYRPMKHKHYSCSLATSLTSILSVRLREGYTIKTCTIANNQIRLDLVLPWKYQVNMEYVVISDWPTPKQNDMVQIEFWTEAPFEFLSDVFTANQTFRSPYRAAVVATFFNSIQNLTQADKILITFESFRTNSIFYSVPDSLKNGMPLFCLVVDSDEPVISSKELKQKHANFCHFWRPICTLDINVWQKWLHTHRITLLLTHDVPLSSHLHSPSSTTGRYGSITCRQAAAAVDAALKSWSTFTLLDNQSYIKFEYNSNEKLPEFFYVIRPTYKPPCVVVRLAFLGGIKGSVRHNIVTELTEKLLSVKINQRVSVDRKTSASIMLNEKNPNEKPVHSQRTDLIAVEACRQTKKPVEKILVRYDKIPKNLSYMVQEEDLNKATTLNNILCRYLHCKRWIWSLKRTSVASHISYDGAALILNALLRKRLKEKFRFAFGRDGVITFLKEYGVIKDSENSSCIVQYVLYPPISTPISGLQKNVSSVKNIRESICSENDPSEAESSSADSNRDIHLVSELWVEPQYGEYKHENEKVSTCEDLFNEFFVSDTKVVKTLATFEHLKMLKNDGERKYLTKQSSSMFSSHKADSESNKFQKEIKSNVVDDFNSGIDQAVEIVNNCFDICWLFESCQMAALTFSSLICAEDSFQNDDLPNAALIEALHHELKRRHDSSLLLVREREVHKFWRLIFARASKIYGKNEPKWLKHLKRRSNKSFEKQLHRLPRIICYVRKISETRLTIIVCPLLFEDIQLMWTIIDNKSDLDGTCKYETESDGSISFPLFAFNCCENLIWNFICDELDESKAATFNFAQDFRNINVGESVLGLMHRQISFLSETEDVDERSSNKLAKTSTASMPFNLAGNRLGYDLDSFNFPWFCNHVELLYSRAFVSAVYRSLIAKCSLNCSDVRLSVEGKCEETNIEIDLTQFLDAVCEHFKQLEQSVGNERPTKRRDTIDSVASSFSINSASGNETPACMQGSPCSTKNLHKYIRETYSIILSRNFQKIANCDEFYFYRPSLHLNEPVSEADSFGTASHDELANNDENVSFNHNETDEESGGDVSAEVSTVLAAANANRTKFSLTTTSTLTRDTLRSIIDVSSCSSSEDSDAEGLDVLNAWRYPMFLNLTCSVSVGAELLSCSLDSFPTCLMEILRKCEFDEWDADLTDMQVSYDVLVLTLGSEDVDTFEIGSVASPNSLYDENSEVKFESLNDESIPSRQLLNIPENQRSVLETLKNEITLLIKNEIFFAYRRSSVLVNSTILRQIAAHIGGICKNAQISNCDLRNTDVDATSDANANSAIVFDLPLTFVLNEADSLAELRAQLKKFASNTYFKLLVSDEGFFYADVDRNNWKWTNLKTVADFTTSEFVEMNPDALTAPVSRLVPTYGSESAKRYSTRRRYFQQRSHSFSGFSRFFYDQRETMLKGKWTSLADAAAFELRSLKRKEVRSGGGGDGVAANSRYWSGTSTVTSDGWPQSKRATSLDNKDLTTETGYEAESSEAAGFDEVEGFSAGGGRPFILGEINVESEFWLILSISNSILNISFLERIPNTHKSEFENFVGEIKTLLKKVNQKMLLKNLLETNRCNSLLLPESSYKYSNAAGDSFTSDANHVEEEDFYEGENNVGYLAASSKFAPGSFACPCVYSRWFNIHPRLKTGAGRVAVNRAMQALKSLLNKFLVHNRENMYVLKETSSDSVFYIKLHDKPNSAQATLLAFNDEQIATYKSKVKFASELQFKPDTRDDVCSINKFPSTKYFAKELQNKLLITVHGISEPGDEVKVQLMNALENKLNDSVLDQLLITLERNRNCKLSVEDVDFLQPKSKPPKVVWSFSLPSIAEVHLYATCFYLRQHLADFMHYPNYSSGTEHFRFYGLNSGPNDEGRIYLYYPTLMSGKGIVVVSQNVVDANGNAIPLLPFDLLDPVDGFASFFQSGLTFESLTSALDCSQSFATNAAKPRRKFATVSTSTTFLQFAVWETGDGSLVHLFNAIKSSVSAALCDLSTEYGLLTVSVLESNGGVDVGPASEPGSPTDKTSSDNQPQATLRKRHSSAAMNTASSKLSIFSFENLQTFVKRSETASPGGSQILDDSRRRHNSQTSKSNVGAAASPVKGSVVRLNSIYATFAPVWFDFVSEMNCQNACLTRFTLQLDADFGCRVVFKEVFDALKRYLSSDSDVFCFSETNAPAFGLGQKFFDKFTPSRSTTDVSCDEDYSADHGHRKASCTTNSVDKESKIRLIVCQSTALFRDTIQLGRNNTAYGTLPESVAIFTNPTARILQRLSPSCPDPSAIRGFVPRQRIILVIFKGRQITFYAYNWISEIVISLKALITRLVCWHNARAHLLKKISYQKMGFFHNIQPSDLALKNNPFLGSYFTDSEHFVVNSVPPTQSASSASLSSKSACSNDYQSCFNCSESMNPVWSDLSFSSGEATSIDPVARHGLQMQHTRTILKKRNDEENQFRQIYRIWSDSSRNENRTPAVDESFLKQMLNRSRLMHAVYTPFLFHPGWREKVGQIRQPGVYPCAPNRPPSPIHQQQQQQRSRHSSGQSQTHKQSSTSSGPVSPLLQSRGAGGHSLFGSGVELWHLQLQNLMAKQYSTYLQSLGLNFLEKKQKRNSTADQFLDPSFSVGDVCEIWFYKIVGSSAVILVRAFFEEPYFAVQFYVLNTFEFAFADAAAEHLSSTSNEELTRWCTRLASLSHLHSFSYDFHMRMVAAYASSDRQINFKAGYNMHAFLNDFLRYYTCRPTYARTYVFEDHMSVSGLSIRSELLYNYILDHDKTYGLRVVRMRVPSSCNTEELTSEYLLTSHDTYVLSKSSTGESREPDISYQVLQILMRDEWTDDFRSPSNVRTLRSVGKDWLSLKFYVIFVDHENTMPLSSSPEAVDSGKYERVRTPSWVIGERLSGDGAVQSRPVLHAVLSSTPDFGGGGHLFRFSPTKRDNRPQSRYSPSNTVSGANSSAAAVASTRLRAFSGDAPRKANVATARFEVSRVSEGDVDHRSDETWRLETSSSTSIDESKFGESPTNKILSKSVGRPPIEGSSLQAEVVNYLTFVTDFESTTQQILASKTAEYKTRLKKVVQDASLHCRREYLWQKLLFGVSTVVDSASASTSRKREDSASGITFFEFQNLLQLTHSISMEQTDPGLASCAKLSSAATKNLVRLLGIKYGDHCRKFVTPDGNSEYLVILNSNYLDTFIMVFVDTKKDNSATINMVYKDFSAVESDAESQIESRAYRHLKIRTFWREFVDVLAFNLWSRLLV